MEAPNLSTNLVEIITQIQGAVATGSDFLLTQLPEIAQQYVLYGRVRTTITVLVCLGLLPLTTLLVKKLNHGLKENSFDERFLLGYCAAFIGYVIIGLSLYHHLTQALLVWIAPKIWLIQTLSALVK